MAIQTETAIRHDTGATMDEATAERAVLRRAPADLIAAIDVGTTKVCAIAGRKKARGGVEVMAHSVVSSRGIRKGTVTDVQASAEAIREAVGRVETATGYKIESAFVGVTGAHITFENRRDKIEDTAHPGVITADSLAGEPEQFTAVDRPGRQMVQAVRVSYSVDGEEGIRNPIGMHSDKVEVDTHVVSGMSGLIDKLEDAVELARVHRSSMVMEPLASSMAVLTPEERENGVVLVDIGGGTSDIVAFEKGKIRYTGVIPVGGYQFTNDIAMMFHTHYEAAEKAKLQCGSAEVYSSRDNQDITFPVDGREMDLKVKGGEISQLTRQRAQELARLIGIKLDQADLPESTRSKMVLTGGGSNLPGLATLMQSILAVEVRNGVPGDAARLPDALKDSAYATAVGILLWAAANDGPAPADAEAAAVRQGSEENDRKGIMQNVLGLFGKSKPSDTQTSETKKGRI